MNDLYFYMVMLNDDTVAVSQPHHDGNVLLIGAIVMFVFAVYSIIKIIKNDE